MLKKILFPLFALFLIHRTYELLRTLALLEPSEIAPAIGILLAVLLNLFITGIFAFVGFAYKTNRLLGEDFYRIKNPQALSGIYQFLKVEYFKKFLLMVFWGKKKNRKKYFDGTKKGLENFDFQTRQSEFGHLASLVIIQFVVCFLLLKGHFAIALWTTLLNFIANFYPIILQRSHRINIARIRNIMERRAMA